MLLIEQGGVTISYGKELEKSQHFGPDWLLCFIDKEGLGHGSRVDKKGCKRIYMQARGHLDETLITPLPG